MYFKTFTLTALVVASSIIIAVMAYTHCHTTHSHEDAAILVDFSQGTWDEPYSNTVNYYINPEWPGEPHLTIDVKAAAAIWRYVQFQGRTINFYPKFQQEDDEKHPGGDSDNVNLVGYYNGGQHTGAPNARNFYYMRTSEFFGEVDIGFNYYKTWKTHANRANDGLCIRDVAAHEWGHFGGLWHVEYNFHLPDQEGNCNQWAYYTMMYGSNWDDCRRETLNCEDRWALGELYP